MKIFKKNKSSKEQIDHQYTKTNQIDSTRISMAQNVQSIDNAYSVKERQQDTISEGNRSITFSVLPDTLKKAIRSSFYLEGEDSSKDKEFAVMPREKILKHLLDYFCVSAAGDDIIQIIGQLYQTNTIPDSINKESRYIELLNNFAKVIRSFNSQSEESFESYLCETTGILKDELILLKLNDKGNYVSEDDIENLTQTFSENNTSELEEENILQEDEEKITLSDDIYEEDTDMDEDEELILRIEHLEGEASYYAMQDLSYEENLEIIQELIDDNRDGHIKNPAVYLGTCGAVLVEYAEEELKEYHLEYKMKENHLVNYLATSV